MTSKTPVDQTPESVVCHSTDGCTFVNSSNKAQQRNNIKLWTEVHVFLAYSNKQKCYTYCKWNGSWITQILAFYNSLVDTQTDKNLLTQDHRSVKAFKDYLPVVFLMTLNNFNST